MNQNSILKKTMPTALGILLLLGGIGAGVFLVRNQKLFGTKTGAPVSPQNISVSNVTANSFNVSWLTATPVVGLVQYGEEEKKLSETAHDYRDKLAGENKSYPTHYINLENLKPSKKYYFKIGSGDNTNLYDNNGRPFELTTGPTLGTQPPNDIIYGKVVDNQQKPVEGAIVSITLANATPISTLSGKDGMWAKPLHTSRTLDLNSYVSYDAELSILTIKAASGSKESENGTVIVTTKNDTPVPPLVLGQNQDFRQEKTLVSEKTIPGTPKTEPKKGQVPQELPSTPETATGSTSPRPDFSQFGNLESSSSAGLKTITITNPAKDGEKINSQKPQILGTGPAGKVLTIELESPEKYTGTVVIDEEGSWSFTPPQSLSPGEHNLTVSYIDELGREKKLTRTFMVLAAGAEQFPSFEASPSATSTPSASPGTRISLPATESGAYQAGTVGPTFFLSLAGLLFLLGGLGLQFYLTRKIRY